MPTAPLLRSKIPSHGATCCSWVATRKALRQDPGGFEVNERVVNGLQHITSALTWSDRRSDRPDPTNRMVMSSPNTNMFYPDCTFKSALAASSRPLSFRCKKVVAGVQLHWENTNLTSAENPKLATAENLPSAWVYWSFMLVSTKANGFPLETFPTQDWLRGGWWSTGPAKNIQHLWHLQIKKKTRHVRRMQEQTSPDSLLLNLWRRSSYLNSRLSS